MTQGLGWEAYDVISLKRLQASWLDADGAATAQDRQAARATGAGETPAEQDRFHQRLRAYVASRAATWAVIGQPQLSPMPSG